MSMRKPGKADVLAVAILTAAALGATMDVPSTKRRKILPAHHPCMNGGKPKRHSNAFCSSSCCDQFKLKKREGLGE